MPKKPESIFIHIVGPDGQMSVHADPNQPLSKAIDEGFKFHGQKRTGKHVARNDKGKKLSMTKSVAANGLKFNQAVFVGVK